MMKKTLLFLFFFISFSNLHAQEINLRNLTSEQRKDYVIQEATRALDVFLYKFLKGLYGPNTPPPTYSPYRYGYGEFKLDTEERVNDFNDFNGPFITDYTVVKNDYYYNVSFVASQDAWWGPVLYKVTVLNNGKALMLFVEERGWFRMIYNATE
ncbi:hypothetical protein U0010_16055 [Myroides odoratus]|uniref:DUF4251 domain-containing protein n=2 Tax=Myroides odoratus TaxID=256 RepID=A0A9Q6Z3D0_MYROD|nr:hypothetical protein [Myroides odoratus]EHQ43406.1 hypothetical protein Myrod_2585 [Myroides odoratus DSM 2801]EKB06072.1 hypothetical protein HMPREF9716_02448 [Myroides odoratus CIP 103059]QQU00743.1 hypothetical protein I6I88_02970 [Myroides odoratus]WQD57017.1 hypothetical protein U0010_16055 [Myroides odoratus]STZ30684.1 Uncharacterised protein [Myroides odoratus]